MGDIPEGVEEAELPDPRSSRGEESPPGEAYEEALRGNPPASIGWSIPMVPLGSPVFPIGAIRGLVGVEVVSGFSPPGVETIGVRPVIGVKGVSPGDAMERGVNMAKFVPPIMGTEPIP